MAIKLICIDMDGTLLKDEHTIAERDKEAIKQLAKYLNLSSDEVMCIGDSENDLSMITFAGTGVAMGNALDIVKDAANFVTTANNDCCC